MSRKMLRQPPAAITIEAFANLGNSVQDIDMGGLSEAEWIERGTQLGRVERVLQWTIGEWWNSGERFGQRVTIVTAPNWTGPSYATCRNYGSLAMRFDVSRRHDTLTYSHHEAVSSLPPEQAERILSQAERQFLETGKQPSVRALRLLAKRERRQVREIEFAKRADAPLPASDAEVDKEPGGNDAAPDDHPQAPIRPSAAPVSERDSALHQVCAALIAEGYRSFIAMPRSPFAIVAERNAQLLRINLEISPSERRPRVYTKLDTDIVAVITLPERRLHFRAINAATAPHGEAGPLTFGDAVDRVLQLGNQADLLTIFPPLPTRRYGVILADCPWSFTTWSDDGKDRAAENHYPTLNTDLLRALGPYVPASRHAVLALWATPAMMPDALAVMHSWGFEYKTEMIWGKPRMGTGYWTRNMHESLLIGARGKPPAPAPGDQRASLQMAPMGRHSEKPIVFHELLEEAYPNTSRLEMFARQQRAGWDVWGVEAPIDADDPLEADIE